MWLRVWNFFFYPYRNSWLFVRKFNSGGWYMGGKLDRLTKITMNRWTLVYYLFLVSHFFSKLPVFSSCYSSNRRGGNAWRIFNYPSQKLLPCGGNRCSVNSIFIFHVLWKIGKTKILLRTEAYDLFKIKWGKRRWNSEPEVNLVV